MNKTGRVRGPHPHGTLSRRSGRNKRRGGALSGLGGAGLCISLLLITARVSGATDTTQEHRSEALRFDVWEYRIEGNSLIDRKTIEMTVYPYLGPGRTIDTVEEARKALESVYHHAGYGTVLVDIPEQEVGRGVVTLKVTESKLDRVRISGSRYYSLGWIRKRLPALEEGKSPNFPELQKELAAFNASSGDRTITPVLRPGRAPGTVEMELKVKDRLPLHGGLGLDDRYTANTTRLRLTADLRYDNLWQREHSLGIGYVVSPADRNQVEVFYGTYMFRLPGSDRALSFYAVHSSSDVATVGGSEVVGSGAIAGLRFTIPLPQGEELFHNLMLGADYKDFSESVSLQGSDLLNTPISYVSFMARYGGTLFTGSGKTSYSLEGRIGIRGLGNTEKEFALKRFRARPDFATLKLKFEHQRKWWWDSRLRLRASGQIADSPLISNEQFSAGGMDSVRGYLSSQQLGDDAIQGSLEWHSPSIARHVAAVLDDFHFLGFIDGAKLRIQEPLPGEQEDYTLAGAGLGLEVSAWKELAGSLYWAVALDDNGQVRSGDSRFHFSLGFSF